MSTSKTPARRRVGRPPLEGGRVKFTTTLPAAAIEQLRELGRGSAAAGILVLLERYKAATRTR